MSSGRRILLVGNYDLVAARRSFTDRLVANGYAVDLAVLGGDSDGAIGLGRPPSAIQRLRRLVSTRRYDLVQSFDSGPNLITGAATATTTARHVATITGRGQTFSGVLVHASSVHRVYDGVFRRALANSAAVVVQNSRDREYFRRLIAPDRLHLILGSGVDLDRFRAPSEEQRHDARSEFGIASEHRAVLFPGRTLRSKGIGLFVEAARLVAGGGGDDGVYEFLIAGGGPKRDTLRSKGVTRLGRNGSVRYLGLVVDMPRLYQAADIVALPTMYAEGMPRVLLEGGASGCVLVASDGPGCADVIAGDGIGRVLPFPLTAESLTAAIEDAGGLVRRESRQERRERFERLGLDLESVFQKYSQLYETLL